MPGLRAKKKKKWPRRPPGLGAQPGTERALALSPRREAGRCAARRGADLGRQRCTGSEPSRSQGKRRPSFCRRPPPGPGHCTPFARSTHSPGWPPEPWATEARGRGRGPGARGASHCNAAETIRQSSPPAGAVLPIFSAASARGLPSGDTGARAASPNWSEPEARPAARARGAAGGASPPPAPSSPPRTRASAGPRRRASSRLGSGLGCAAGAFYRGAEGGLRSPPP